MSRRAFSVLLGAWAAAWVITVVQGVQRLRLDALVLRRTSGGSLSDIGSAVQRITTWWSFSGALDVVLLVAIALGAARVGGRLGRGLVVAALITAATSLFTIVVNLVAPTWAESEAARTAHMISWGVGIAAVLATRGLSLAIAWRTVDRAARVVAGIAGVCVVAVAGVGIARVVWEIERSRTTGLLTSILSVAAEGGVVLAFALARRRVPSDVDAGEPGAWSRAAAGVRLYATALRWNVGVAAALYGLVLIAVVGKSGDLLSTLAWIGTPAQALAAILLAVALHRLGDAPDRRVAGWAWTAFGAVLCGLALHLFALIEARALLRLVTDGGLYGYERDQLAFHVGVLRLVEAAAVVVGLGGTIAVLLALRAIAVVRGHVALASRAGALAIGVAVSTTFAVGVRWMLSDPEAAARRPVPTLLVAALAVVAALSILIAVIAFVDALVRALDEQVIGSA